MATAREDANSTMGIKTALRRSAFTAAWYISPVRFSKSAVLRSSVERVLMVLAPVMPSLKAPVSRELVRRTIRFQWRILSWNFQVRMAMAGTTSSTRMASFQFKSSMARKVPPT